MTSNFLFWGAVIDQSQLHSLPGVFLSMLEACEEDPHCDLIEVRFIEENHHAIIINAADGTFDSVNKAGIRRVERLAIGYNPNRLIPWEVRALRSDFPRTMHQNLVYPGEPASLCLYAEEWAAVERTWTPQDLLQRMFWWLRETAQGTLHRADQPLEQLFFNCNDSFVLPEDYMDKIQDNELSLVFTSGVQSINRKTYIAHYISAAEANNQELPLVITLPIVLQPIEHGIIETTPRTLADLVSKVEARCEC